MHRRYVHFVLIFVLAVAPLQSALAGLMALSHATSCEMSTHDMSMHEGMQHDQADQAAGTDSCECCDSSSLCLVVSAPVTAVMNAGPAMPYMASAQVGDFSPMTANSQYPPTELRPPIVRL